MGDSLNITNKEILAKLDLKVIGHTAAKKALINTVTRSRIRYEQSKQNIPPHQRIKLKNLLLVGASGTGKTYMLEVLSKMLDFPFLKIDGSGLLPVGAVSGGVKPADLLKKIDNYVAISRHQFALDRLVVFIDEIDKIANKKSHDVFFERAQSAFLTIFENADPKYQNIVFIFAGAFSGLQEHKTIKNTLGFHKQDEEERKIPVLDEALIKYGMIPELIGRMHTIAELDQLSVQDYCHILNTVIIPKKKKELQLFHHYSWELWPDQVLELAKKAIKSDQGVRWLQREVDKLTLDFEFDYEEKLKQKQEDYEELQQFGNQFI